MKIKICFKCGEAKSETEFYRHPEMADGRLGKCIDCAKADAKGYRRKGLAYYHEYDRVRYQTPERKQQASAWRDRYRAAHPDRYRAQTAVAYAVRRGRLLRQPCEVCGDAKSEAHHHDYSKPLEVEWLCFKCHREHAHGQIVTVAA